MTHLFYEACTISLVKMMLTNTFVIMSYLHYSFMRFSGDVVRTCMVNLSYEVELVFFFDFIADIALLIKKWSADNFQKSLEIKLNR